MKSSLSPAPASALIPDSFSALFGDYRGSERLTALTPTASDIAAYESCAEGAKSSHHGLMAAITKLQRHHQMLTYAPLLTALLDVVTDAIAECERNSNYTALLVGVSARLAAYAQDPNCLSATPEIRSLCQDSIKGPLRAELLRLCGRRNLSAQQVQDLATDGAYATTLSLCCADPTIKPPLVELLVGAPQDGFLRQSLQNKGIADADTFMDAALATSKLWKLILRRGLTNHGWRRLGRDSTLAQMIASSRLPVYSELALLIARHQQ